LSRSYSICAMPFSKTAMMLLIINLSSRGLRNQGTQPAWHAAGFKRHQTIRMLRSRPGAFPTC
jgi:hypothetical protein